MNKQRVVSRTLLLLAAFSLAGCAEDVAVERVAGTPQPGTEATEPEQPATEAQPGAEAPDGEQPGTDTANSDDGTSSETTEPAEAVVGGEAPDFVATGLDGEPASLSDYFGEQNVVLAFSRANW